MSMLGLLSSLLMCPIQVLCLLCLLSCILNRTATPAYVMSTALLLQGKLPLLHGWDWCKNCTLHLC